MRMKHLWLSVVTGAAVGVASYYLKKKLLSAAPAAASGTASPSEEAPASAASKKEAVYSFISGFKDAAAVEFRFDYDPDRFHFAVVEDDFLAESGDSHVGILTGVKFRDGDNFCLAFPVPEDAHSYLLLTLVKAPDNDDELETIPDSADFRSLLNSASFRRV